MAERCCLVAGDTRLRERFWDARAWIVVGTDCSVSGEKVVIREGGVRNNIGR